MRHTLARYWFLLLLLGTVGLAWLVPGRLQPWTGRLDVRPVIALALFLMAWTLESRSLLRAVLRPWPALWAVAVSYGALPLGGWLVGRLVHASDFRVGLMIFASVPCTLASAVLWTRLAGGNEAVALLVVVLTTGTSWLVTPLWVAFGTGTEVAVNTLDMMRNLLLILLLPVVLGQLCRATSPLVRLATRRRRPLSLLSQALILAIILKAAVDLRARVAGEAAGRSVGDFLITAALSVGLHLAALGGGLWSSRGLRFGRPEQVAVAFACSQKTLPVGLLLFETYFKDAYPLAVVPMVCYHVGQLVVDTFIADALAGRAVAADVPAEPPV